MAVSNKVMCGFASPLARQMDLFESPSTQRNLVTSVLNVVRSEEVARWEQCADKRTVHWEGETAHTWSSFRTNA